MGASHGVSSRSVLGRFLDKVFYQMNKRYDIFLVITGAEGVGKSRGMFLNIADYWFRHLLKKKNIDKNSITVSVDKFVKCLSESDPFSFVGLDEAGDSMDSQDWANKFNKVLYQVYTIIREKFLFSVVVLPSFFDLSPRFRKRRVRFLIDVYKRVDNRCKTCKDVSSKGYKVAHQFVGDKCDRCGSTDFDKGFVMYDIYDKFRISQIIEKNSYKTIKKIRCGVTPLASGRVGEYDGELKDFYSELKRGKMDDVLNKLLDETQVFSGETVKPKCTHDWRYRRTDNLYWCRKCGFETHQNPFRSDKEVDKVKNNNKAPQEKEKGDLVC